MTDRIADLERLQRLRAEGAIDEAEFAAEKARLLDSTAGPQPRPRVIWVAVGVSAIALIGAAAIAVSVLRPAQRQPQPVVSRPNPSPAPSNPLAGLSPTERLRRAEAAVFPNGRNGQTKDGTSIVYEPGRLIDTPFGPVLVSEGSVPDASHAESGHVGIFYLATVADGYRLVKAFPDAIQSGSFGSMSALSVSTKFSSLPVVYAAGGGTWQGYTCSWTTLSELQPSGPVELITFEDTYDNGGGGASGDEPPVSTEGKIADIVRDRSFAVVFTGSRNFTAGYLRQGNKYVLQGSAKNILDGC